MTELEAWERCKIVWQHAFFAGALGLGTMAALAGGEHDAGAVALRLGLVGALAAWYAYWFGWDSRRRRLGASGAGRTHPGRIRRRPAGAVHLPYLIGAAVLWAVLTAVDPALLVVGVAALIPYCMRHPMWSAATVAAVSAAWIGPDLLEGSLGWLTVATCLVGAGTVVAIAGYITTLDRESRARQRLLDELAAAQAELAAAERNAGTLAERQRLARDIHDTLTQGFASIGMLLDAAQADLRDGHPAAGHIARAIGIARENLAESRRLVWALRPVPLDGTRLADAINTLTDQLADQTGIRATTVVTGTPGVLPAIVEAGLLRVAQEALTNVRRHASATEV
ncbi:MAG: histidine kinase, partial [Sporichthyaceae bacterium]|nr:histidine kinase [Sporichthyaceae bacterium]